MKMEKTLCSHFRCIQFDKYRQFKLDDYDGFDCMINHGADHDMVDKPYEYENYKSSFGNLVKDEDGNYKIYGESHEN